MKLILVPTDFSENANNALEYATETAAATGAALLLVHVHVPPVSRQSAIHSIMAEDIGRATKEARENLQTIVDTIKGEYKAISCSYEVVVGEPVPEVLAIVKDKKPDLIIMGTQGASRVVNVLFGSNTAAIIEKTECPVLCVPHSLPYKAPKRILFATTFSFSDISIASKLVEMAKAFDASIIFGHVVVGVEETAQERAVVEKFAKEIELVTGYHQISGKVLSDATINTGLDAMIEETGVDMIALATRKRNIFERFYNPSITKKFSYYTTIPLLAFHSPKDEEKTGRDF